ncbi:MAG: carboxypeptidase-like regulatory domain-containing protein, partial [Bacteroidetes bacterium]|nr:carboxypeptidase-like regulatory domain-containing protein [Bacteroidota bacterium]
MQRIATLSLLFTLLFWLSFSQGKVYAGDTGKISGRVIDASTKQPLIGANVLIVGTSMGAATDINGRYVILDVHPGTYTLRASAVGYQTEEIKNNAVSIDLTTDVNFGLNQSAVTTKAVVVTARRPLVQKDMTATTAIVNSRQIESLPVTNFKDVLNLQAGIYTGPNGTLHARGGRGGEVTYMIDGVPVTDPYDGSDVIGVNTNAIQQMQLVTGAFNAEYGQAMSGIVNIATKTGGNHFHGSITAYSGGYATSNASIFNGLQTINPLNDSWLEGSLDGPIVKNKLFFYADARYYYSGGDYFGFNKFNVGDVTNTTNPTPALWSIQETGNGKIAPLDPRLEAYIQGKLTYKISPEVYLAYNFILNNHPSVTPQTRQRVLDVAARLNYQPHTY